MMKELRLIRLSEFKGEGGACTLGTLVIDGLPRFATLEPPWKDNQQDISCIPPGEYICAKIFSKKFKCKAFWIKGIKGREGVIIHRGNFPKDTLGCVLLGKGYREQVPAISDSRESMVDFMKRLRNVEQFKLKIINTY